MKADPITQSALLDVQAQDSVIVQLTHRRSTLPEIAQIEQLQAQRAELDGHRVEADTEVSDLTREQKKADAEVELVKTRQVRDEERLNSGAIGNPKDLASLQHELEALARRITTLEDEELEVMERLETAQARLRAVTADIGAIDTDLEHLSAARDSASSEIDGQLDAARIDRESVARSVPENLMALYDKMRDKHGTGAAMLQARRCEGCRLELNSADLREIAAAPEDEVLRCPECDRILVRTPESGL